MRQLILFSSILLATLSTAVALRFGLNSKHVPHLPNSAERQGAVQLPMGPSPAQPLPEQGNNVHTVGRGNLTISDILPRTRSINIFASLTRDVSSIEKRMEDASSNSTVLAPLNSAMQNLPRKPWEDRPSDKSTVNAATNTVKAQDNLQRFVEEHIVPVSPWEPGKENKIKTLAGDELWWEERSGKRVIMPGELIVDKVLGSVNNGEVWSVKGVVGYAYT